MSENCSVVLSCLICCPLLSCPVETHLLFDALLCYWEGRRGVLCDESKYSYVEVFKSYFHN